MQMPRRYLRDILEMSEKYPTCLFFNVSDYLNSSVFADLILRLQSKSFAFNINIFTILGFLKIGKCSGYFSTIALLTRFLTQMLKSSFNKNERRDEKYDCRLRVKNSRVETIALFCYCCLAKKNIFLRFTRENLVPLRTYYGSKCNKQ